MHKKIICSQVTRAKSQTSKDDQYYKKLKDIQFSVSTNSFFLMYCFDLLVILVFIFLDLSIRSFVFKN